MLLDRIKANKELQFVVHTYIQSQIFSDWIVNNEYIFNGAQLRLRGLDNLVQNSMQVPQNLLKQRQYLFILSIEWSEFKYSASFENEGVYFDFIQNHQYPLVLMFLFRQRKSNFAK